MLREQAKLHPVIVMQLTMMTKAHLSNYRAS
jgi:hypothetical protein